VTARPRKSALRSAAACCSRDSAFLFMSLYDSLSKGDSSVCVLKIRLGNIGGEVRRGSAVKRWFRRCRVDRKLKSTDAIEVLSDPVAHCRGVTGMISHDLCACNVVELTQEAKSKRHRAAANGVLRIPSVPILSDTRPEPRHGDPPDRYAHGEYARHGHIEYSDRNVLSASIVATRRVALTSSIQTEDRCPERKPAVVS
jgi:hypothetical protein